MPMTPNRWTEIGPGTRANYSLARCECGTEREVRKSNGKFESISCGCFQRETIGALSTKHGLSQVNSPTYNSWLFMKSRSANPNSKQSKDYVGRGIAVCARWKDSFEAFLLDMGERPSEMTLDRIDNNLGYLCGNSECPECGPKGCELNCRWATRATQQRNRRNNRVFTYNGKTMCLKDWAEELGIKYGNLLYRIKVGDSFEEAISRRRYFRRRCLSGV
jgi:hypothetical protein